MCTAITYSTHNHYFGRNLDLEYGYHETVTVTPRIYPFHFRCMGSMRSHLAMIGMAYADDGYPLYYDATNEKGLSMAGLNFPGNACYHPVDDEKDNVTPFELIPWILGQCENLAQARKRLEKINLADISYSETLPLSPLHWIVSDRSGSITVEPMADGLHIYDNPVGVLTNNPPFDYHLINLRNYMNLSPNGPENRFSEGYPMKPYSTAMGAMGLPGDFSSASRFVRAAFLKLNSVSGPQETESVRQFFHVLNAVAMTRGSVRPKEGVYDITRYSCCCNTDRGIYYYTTYENSQINGVDMHRENLDGSQLICYPLLEERQLRIQN